MAMIIFILREGASLTFQGGAKYHLFLDCGGTKLKGLLLFPC